MRPAWISRLNPFRRREPLARSAAGATDLDDPEAALGPDDPSLDPVSSVLRRTDVWFAHRMGALEQKARELAATHAAVGQPRHDLRRDGPLEMEIILDRQAGDLVRSWAQRVRVKLVGAIEREVEGLGAGVSEMRESVSSAQLADQQVAYAQDELRQRMDEQDLARSSNADDTVEIERELSGWVAAIFLVLLVIADLFANLPIFTELLPTNAQLQSALVEWEEQRLAEGLDLTFGLNHLAHSLLANPEPGLLALTVIIFFLFLGHKLGESLRKVVFLWRDGRRAGSPHRGSHLRPIIPAMLSAAGIVLTLVFLYGARANVAPMAQQRLVAAEQELTELQAELTELEAAEAEVPSSFFERQAAAEEAVLYRTARLDYAETISAVNRSMLFLNLVLVMAAVLIGYSTTRGRIRGLASRQREIELASAKSEFQTARLAFAEHRRGAHAALRRADGSVTRIEHLLGTAVLEDLEAKKARVRCAIPLFRSENARLRGLDVSDIIAFQTPPSMDLPTPEDLSLRVDAPPNYADYRRELVELKRRLTELDTQTDMGDRDDGGSREAWMRTDKLREAREGLHAQG